MIQAVVAGATGLVGQNIVRLLLERADVSVTALVRRGGSLTFHPRLKEQVFDFESSGSYRALGQEIPCDVLFCALGTTRKKAGSDSAFRRVDLYYPASLIAALAQKNPKAVVALVSSVGADRPAGLYLKTKARLEEKLKEGGLAHVIARPSFLLGERSEVRRAEQLASRFFVPLMAWVTRTFPNSRMAWKYAPVPVESVARALIGGALDKHGQRSIILEGIDLIKP
jgi:uncharacterized protein YbjT (DUF2867 family)